MTDEPLADGRPARPDVFISYKSKDVALADVVFRRLSAAGFRVWFDKARLIPGCDWHNEIEAGCEAARVTLPLITPNWQTSEWTRYETYGHSAILPLRAGESSAETLTPPLRGKQGITLDPLTATDVKWRTLIETLNRMLDAKVPEQTGRLVDLPYPPNPFFAGRDADMVRIHEEMHQRPQTVLPQGKVHASVAMGGVGKTTLANEYARRHWRAYPRTFRADARPGYLAEFARMFDRLFPTKRMLRSSLRTRRHKRWWS